MIPKLQSARNDCTYSLFEQKSPYTYLSIYLENQKKKRCANNLINPITESQKEKKSHHLGWTCLYAGSE